MSFSTNQKMLITLSVVLIVVGVSFTIYNWPECSEIMNIPMDGFVNTKSSQYWGMDTSKDHLAFGGMSLGSTIKRSMTVKHKEKAIVDVRLSGNIASFVEADPAIFTIDDGQEQQVDFYFSPPYGTPQGDYNGHVVYCFKNAD